MSTHSRPTPETDALIHKINADMDAAEAAGTELSADVPMREVIDHARRLEQQRDECVEALNLIAAWVYGDIADCDEPRSAALARAALARIVYWGASARAALMQHGGQSAHREAKP